MTLFWNRVFVLFFFISTSLLVQSIGKKWKDIDFDKLERDWQKGDSKKELESADADLAKQIEKKKSSGQVGPTMMFVIPKPQFSNKESMEDLSSEIVDTAHIGGFEVKAFHGPGEPPKLIVTMQKGWEGEPVYEMIQKLEKVERVDWGDKDKIGPIPQKKNKNNSGVPKEKKQKHEKIDRVETKEL